MKIIIAILFSVATAHSAVTVAWEPDQPVSQIAGYVVTAVNIGGTNPPVSALTEKTNHTFQLPPGNYTVSIRVIGRTGKMSEPTSTGEFRVVGVIGEVVVESVIQQSNSALGPWTDVERRSLVFPQTEAAKFFRGAVTTRTNTPAAPPK